MNFQKLFRDFSEQPKQIMALISGLLADLSPLSRTNSSPQSIKLPINPFKVDLNVN